MTQPVLPPSPTGLLPTDDYVAQQTIQGGRIHYAVALPLSQVPVVLPVPDPSVVLEDNRKIVPGHAQAFADYIRRNSEWHSGSLTVRTTSRTVRFDAFGGGDYGNLKIGLLKIPRNDRQGFRIVDGQHRVLGIDRLLGEISKDLVDQTSRVAASKRNGEPAAAIKSLAAKLTALEQVQQRVAEDSIFVDLIVEDDAVKARQIFVDVANNALGITKSVTTRFDSRKVVNRALHILLSSGDLCPLLVGKVDLQQDRIGGTNPNLLGAKHVADIIRTVAVGANGRVSKVQEKTLDAELLARQANRFFEVIQGAFSDLDAIGTGRERPADVRPRSVVVSTTMLRVLSGVYYELKAEGTSEADITSFFARLSTHMRAPITAGTRSGDLLIGATKSDAFSAGATAPGARAQQVRELVTALAGWSANPPKGF